MTGRRPHPLRRLPWLTVAAALALAPLAAAPALAHSNGDKVEVTGVVTAPDGRPLAGVQVQLEAARREFSFRSFKRITAHTARLTALTDGDGRYALSWPWNSYFNSFELAVGVPVRKSDGEHFEALEQVDVTQRIKQASPVVVSVVVRNAEFVVALRKFLASVDSEDERRVYRDLGRPDKVEERVDPVDGRRAEATWWYFESGQAYRFRDGVLAGVDRFDPVKGF